MQKTIIFYVYLNIYSNYNYLFNFTIKYKLLKMGFKNEFFIKYY